MKYLIRTTEQYETWIAKQPKKTKAQIAKRLSAIEVDGYFGTDKALGEGLAELKWKNGRRIYYVITLDEKGNTVFLILGGNKNGQSKDIAKARKIQGTIG